MKIGASLLFFVTEDWYFCSHRLPLALAAIKAGYNVTVVTRVRSHGDKIQKSGLKLIPLELSRRSINPFKEICIIWRLILIYKSEQPDIVHHVALKPVVYGTIASYFSRTRGVVNAMAGLGFIFSSTSIKARLARPILKFLFRLIFKRSGCRVILQNPDDVRLMCDSHIINKNRIALIKGSGVDVEQFCMQPEPSGQPVVILASRLLWAKGVGEFVNAARLLTQEGVVARFILVGEGDEENPSAIPDRQLHLWKNEGVVDWWGRKEDMSEIIGQSHIVCLPSYYGEGVPKALIEAASCGRPVVTTDTPGCREIVRDGFNGYLVPVRDVRATADALKKLIDSPELRIEMGLNGRDLVERDFTLEKVNAATLEVYQALMQ